VVPAIGAGTQRGKWAHVGGERVADLRHVGVDPDAHLGDAQPGVGLGVERPEPGMGQEGLDSVLADLTDQREPGIPLHDHLGDVEDDGLHRIGHGTFLSNSSSHSRAEVSDGIRQSPRGDSDPPRTTLGPLGRAERLNWLNRRSA
jgi:hypothetical protein